MQTFESDPNLKDIKLIAVDMDKTLLTDERVLPEGLDERLAALEEAGIVFCPASGRPAPRLEEMFPTGRDEMAFCPDNGGSLIYKGELIYKSNIDESLYHRVLDFAVGRNECAAVLCTYNDAYMLERDRPYDADCRVYYPSIKYVETFDEVHAESNKISLFFPAYDAEPLFRNVYAPEFSDVLYATNAGREWIDFMNLGVDKGSGVAHLCNQLGIDIADAAAVGDTYNDIPMLERVGHSFIVANAEEHMQAHAKYMVPSNNDGGVLTLIDAILAARK